MLKRCFILVLAQRPLGSLESLIVDLDNEIRTLKTLC